MRIWSLYGTVALFLRRVLQQLFMQGYGRCDVTIVYPGYLILSIFTISVTTFLMTTIALRQVIKWNAIRSIQYVDANDKYRKKVVKTSNDLSLFRMAWRNITRSRKRFLISSLSLILGGITALGAAVIMTGVDLRNSYQENPDFQTGILAGIFRYPSKVPGEIDDDTQVMSEEMVDYIYEIDGVDTKSINFVEGSYALINLNEDAALLPRKDSIGGSTDKLAFATIQIIDESYVEKLEVYVEKYEVSADISSLKNGTGCLLLHYHEMSQILDDQAKGVIGEPIHFYSLNAYDKTGNLDMYRKNPLECAGYIDCTAKYFPKLETTSMGNKIHYFIMTEEAFQKLKLPKKVFNMSFDAVIRQIKRCLFCQVKTGLSKCLTMG